MFLHMKQPSIIISHESGAHFAPGTNAVCKNADDFSLRNFAIPGRDNRFKIYGNRFRNIARDIGYNSNGVKQRWCYG